MSSENKIIILRTGTFFLLLVAAGLAYAYQTELKEFIKLAFDSKWPIGITAIYVIVCAIMRQVFVGSDQSSDRVGAAIFGSYAGFIISIVTLVPACTTSIALLKGIFMQHFFGKNYFVGFDSLDFVSIFIVSSFLLYYGLLESTKDLIKAITNVDAVAINSKK